MLRELEIRGITYMSSKVTVAQVAAGLLVQGLVGNSGKKSTHIVAIEWQAVPRATNEAQLHPGNGVEHGEELLVAIVINNDVGEQRDSYCRYSLLREASIEHFYGDVLYARAMFIEVSLHCGVVAGSEKNY